MDHPDLLAASIISWESHDLIPAVVQDAATAEVLMIGFMNQQALTETLATSLVHFFSRSRGRLWRKGERSGNTLHVEEVRVNCENNALLIRVTPTGPTCHTGHISCFYRSLDQDGSLVEIADVVRDPVIMYGPSDADLTQLWYRAYEYLRDNDHTTESGTSRRLRTDDEPLAARLADELTELAGVLDGTHTHQGLIADVILEGSQSIYWTALIAIHAHVPWSTLRPDHALATTASDLSRAVASRLLRAEAAAWATDAGNGQDMSSRCHATIALIAQAVNTAGVDPSAILQRDLDDLRTRPYLAELFEQF